MRKGLIDNVEILNAAIYTLSRAIYNFCKHGMFLKSI